MTARLISLRYRAAFSLVEVALAMGIVAFALVAVFGLLSVGINASHDSDDDTKVALIMQDVATRLRAETSNVETVADASKMDLTWNAAYNGKLNYTLLGSTSVPPESTGQPGAAATAYYTADGQLVKQSTATAPTTNFYKAAIYVQPLTSYPTNVSVTAGGGYPFLAVTVKVGWPTDHTVNGSVLGQGNAAKSVATFYLLKP